MGMDDPKGVEFPEPGVTGSCKLTNVGARNETLVLCKSRVLLTTDNLYF